MTLMEHIIPFVSALDVIENIEDFSGREGQKAREFHNNNVVNRRRVATITKITVEKGIYRGRRRRRK